MTNAGARVMSDHSPPIWHHRVPNGFWQQSKNRRACMEWFEAKLGIREPEDWYDLTMKTIHYFGVRGLLNYYGTINAMVRDYLPWYDWKEWLFPVAPAGFWDDAQNQLRYLKWLGDRLGFKTWEDWYRVRARDFVENRGGALVGRSRGGGMVALIVSRFPEYEWHEWRFNHVPTGFWDDPVNRRRYLKWLGDRLGYEEPEDWYGLRVEHLLENHGGSLLMRYKGSPPRVVMSNFPESVWLEWRFAVTPKHFWSGLDNRSQYLKWLGERLGFETPDDWYRLSYDDLAENHGHNLLLKYSASPCCVIKASFPEHDWLEWRFSRAPLGFWDDAGNRQRYLEWLKERLGFEKTEDWYTLTHDILQQNHGGGISAAYGCRVSDLVKDNFPGYDWHEWLFNTTPSGFWDDVTNQRRYLEWLGRKLGCEKPEDWYQVRAAAFFANRGGPLVKRYNHSYVNMLSSCFPEFEWLEWRFNKRPIGAWGDPANRRGAIDWLGEQLGYDDPDDWYLITARDFLDHGLGGLLSRYNGSPIAAVTDVLTEHDWKEWFFSRIPRGYWAHRRNRRRYLDWLGEELGFAEPGDWTRLSYSDLKWNRGKALYELFDWSVRAVLLNTFPASHPVHRVIRDT